MKREDIEYLESLIMTYDYDNPLYSRATLSLGDIKRVLDVSKELENESLMSSYLNIQEVKGYIYADHWDHSIHLENMSIRMESENNSKLIEFFKEHGSGKYNTKWDEYCDRDWLDFEIYIDDLCGLNELPSFLEKSSDYEISSNDDDVYVEFDSISKQYYYQS